MDEQGGSMKGQMPSADDNKWSFIISYGWIFIVAVVGIIIILNVGLFKPAPTCITQPGFFCEAPEMNTSGVVNVQFGQIVSSQIIITSVGCSQNATTFPNTTPTEMPVVTDQMTGINFNCDFSQNNKIGNSFVGYLWITYDTGSSSDLLMQFGKVVTTVSTSTPVLIKYPQLSGSYVNSGICEPYSKVYCFAQTTTNGGFAPVLS